MLFPESWLREFCDPALGTEALAEVLTMGGFEVESTRPVAPAFTGVVVGEILACEQHPNADRLRVCQVNVGLATPLNIVCGAPNARSGLRVPCATVGAVLPAGEDGEAFHIKLGKLRGVESQGMLCSASELQVSQESSGLMELAADAPIGENIRTHLRLDDTIFEVKLTPNLGHALSVYGLARELSALTGAPLKTPSISPVALTSAEVRKVSISAIDLCGRFSGRVLRGLNPKAPTPQWMVDKLARCGQRSVTALVDISNYVMFEYGRPSHIFDLDKIHGAMDVRWAKAGESLKLLNGNTVALDEKVGVIADEQGVESLAGIMGGDSTAVGDDTTAVYLEAAFWWPDAVAGRARRFNFSTDAGHRFERGVDPSLTLAHVEHITKLLLDICGTPQTTVGPVDDQAPNLPVPRTVKLRVARASTIIGMPLTQERCAQALAACGFALTEAPGVITAAVPAHRFDVTIEEDLIEEVARLVGYNNLPLASPVAPLVASLANPATARSVESKRSLHAVRRALADLGYHETLNFSFVPEAWETTLAANSDPVRLLNPMSNTMAVMRSSLLGSLLEVLKHNLARKASTVRVFEVARVFARAPDSPAGDLAVKGIHQPMKVAGLIYGPANGTQWRKGATPADFYDMKADVEALLAPQVLRFESAEHPAMHPGRCAAVLDAQGNCIGHVGELHPKHRQANDLPHAPMLFELDAHAVCERALPKVQTPPKFPMAERDLAFVLDSSVTHAQLMASIHAAPLGELSGCLLDAVLFDIYRPKAETPAMALTEKSCAVRLSFQNPAATLTDPQLDAATQAIVAHVARTLGGRLR